MLLKKMFPALIGVNLVAIVAGTTPGQEAVKEPGRLGLKSPAQNHHQQIADAIAERLRAEVSLRGQRVDILFAEGVADLSGIVTDAAQRDLVLSVVQKVPGVEGVRDRLSVLRGAGVMRVQGGDALPQLPQFGFGTGGGGGPPLGAPQEPLPIFQAPPGPNPMQQPPPLPPYAWPSTAPYNNYSRVAYPQAYPYNAFPFIGPMYPYPKVPLGWRKVSLEWQDGYWWYGKGATGHDWWRIRYW